MRRIVHPDVERARIRSGPARSETGDDFGLFFFSGPCGAELKVIASAGDENIQWEHVSVSLPNRTPNWKEMCFIKDLFFSEEETVMQLHPPKSQYVNVHEYCLHLWRPKQVEIPMPPLVAV